MYGGAGADKLYSVVQMEELARGGFSGIGFGLHSEIVAPYILHYGTEEQKQNYLPRLASGEMVGAIAMSEPAAGSDLQGIRTTALRQADGSYLLNGSKTFITNGWHADLVIVVAKTDPNGRRQGHQPAAGGARHAGLREGQAAEETGAEGAGHFRAVLRRRAVPAEHLLGGTALENRGFVCLMEQLPWERCRSPSPRWRRRRRRSSGRCTT
jgi:alkylation response protein AidB-like acyl-CoA dehydrogenase